MSTTSRVHPKRILLDSSGLYAMLDAADGSHMRAQAVWERVIQDRWITFTTNFVVAESHALILNRLGRPHAMAFLQSMMEGRTTVVRVSLRDEQRARAIILQYQDKLFSLTDATSFSVMERLRIGTAFTFDSDFLQYGFAALHVT